MLPAHPAVQPVTRADVEAAFDLMEQASLHAANLLRNYMRAMEARLEQVEADLAKASAEAEQLRREHLIDDEKF